MGDAADYARLADGLSTGVGYVDGLGRPTAWRPPGYPAFLATVHTVAPGPTALAVVQAGVGAAVVAVTWAVARVLGPIAALVAAGLVAVDVVQIALASRTLSEGLFTLLSLGVVALSLGLARDLRTGAVPWGAAVATGALAGAAVLTRGLFVAYPLALAAGLVALGARGGALRRGALVAAVMLAAYGAVLLPWTARNARAMGAPVPVATQGGFTLYASWFPPGGTGFGILPTDAVTAGAVGLSEVEQNAYFTERAIDGVLADPGRVPRLLALKLLYFFVPLDWEVLPRPGVVNPSYLFVLVWTALALGLARGRLGLVEHWPLWLPIFYSVAMALVFYGSPRIRAPVEPLLAAAAAVGLVEWARTRGRRSAALAVGGSVAGVAAVALLAAPLKALALAALRGAGIWRG